MRYEPSMWLQRLVVVRGGEPVYDEHFHLGTNIIRGANSTGKSTIADLIFFVLGGDVTKWKDEAGICDSVFAQVCLNGFEVTLKRDISSIGQQPMWLFEGPYLKASESSQFGWKKYPYSRRGDLESFTQVIFRMLKLPDVPGDAGANITMHQLLRLMYVDQMTPVDRIFRFESNDSAIRRQAVGDLLCGILDSRIYPAQLLLRDKLREYDVADKQLTGLHKLLDKVDGSPTVELMRASLANCSRERALVAERIEKLKERRFEQSDQSGEGQKIVAQLKASLNKVNRDLAATSTDISQLELAIEDASALIAEIERNLSQIKTGQATTKALGPISFNFCPSCYSPVAESSDAHECSLCRSRIDPESERARFVRMRNELELQLKESNKLQQKRIGNLAEKKRFISKITILRDRLSSEYLSLVKGYVSDAEVEIEHLTARIGYLDREAIDLDRQLRLASELQELSSHKSRLNLEISDLREKIRNWSLAKERRQEIAYGLLQKKTAEVLGMDIPSEAEFTAETSVYFDFSEDRISVAGKSGFSASSLTVIRNSFHLALLWAACLDREFEYPRFLLMDNIEDKGMTQPRSQHFQKAIVHISSSIKTEHQIIFTTSMIDPELEQTDLVVGDSYKFDRKSLRIGPAGGIYSQNVERDELI